jgi:16S rRNA processing protein RimM
VNAVGSPGDRPIQLGHVSGVHGVKGWVKIYSHTRPKQALLNYQPWLLGKERKEICIEEGRSQGKTLIVLFPGINDREQAHKLLNQEIAVHRCQLPDLPEGEYYWTDLIGLDVITVDGKPLGHVKQMLETGANDVLVVQGERERLIPFVQGQYVTEVDLTGGKLTVDWDAEF